MAADFSELYNTHYMQVYSFVISQARNRELAEEVTQKTFFKALTTTAGHSGEASEFTWLCAIAKHLLADEARANRHSGELAFEPTADVDIEHAVINRDAAFRVHQVLHEMEEPYKEVFQLRVFGELPFEKIARLFDKTENWARVTYYRARLKIQERMEEE